MSGSILHSIAGMVIQSFARIVYILSRLKLLVGLETIDCSRQNDRDRDHVHCPLDVPTVHCVCS